MPAIPDACGVVVRLAWEREKKTWGGLDVSFAAGPFQRGGRGKREGEAETSLPPPSSSAVDGIFPLNVTYVCANADA